MGCAQSKIENEEAVSRCKDRRQFMKDAVSARNAFAAAHSSYIVSLKNTGAALSDFGQGETIPHTSIPSSSSSSAAAAPRIVPPSSPISPPPPLDNLLPPPPPLPEFSPSPLIQRSVSLPDLPKKYVEKSPRDDAIREEEDGDEIEESRARAPTSSVSPSVPDSGGLGAWDYFFPMDENMSMPMPGHSVRHVEEIQVETDVTPEKVGRRKEGGVAHHQHAASSGAVEIRKGKLVAAAAAVSNVSLVQVLKELDEHFLRASESAHEVSKMLEATRMHYHSNFADNRGHIDHSARVMRVITWNRSFKGMPYANDGRDDFDNDEWETHATILDKMLAWEKKLYDEVKAGELMKIEYQRKVSLLNKQKKRSANPETIEKTKAAVSHLHTRYIVDMQSMDSTVSEIQHLRDNQLYPRLVELVDGLGKMWQAMFSHHDSQLKIVIDLRVLDISNALKETSEHHYGRTVQLYEVAKEWQSQFQKLVTHQKEYIQALNSWLKLNLIPIESSLKEKVSSPPRIHHPQIQGLLYAWNDLLEKLPDDLAKSAISSFFAVINTIKLLQQEELKLKEKCEETQREYTRKLRAFEDWHHKYTQRRAAASTTSAEGEPENTDVTDTKDPVTERKFLVDSLKTKLDYDVEAYQKACKQVREKTVGSLKSHLPELFRAMSDFSLTSSDMYKKLKAISQVKNVETTS